MGRKDRKKWNNISSVFSTKLEAGNNTIKNDSEKSLY